MVIFNYDRFGTWGANSTCYGHYTAAKFRYGMVRLAIFSDFGLDSSIQMLNKISMKTTVQ